MNGLAGLGIRPQDASSALTPFNSGFITRSQPDIGSEVAVTTPAHRNDLARRLLTFVDRKVYAVTQRWSTEALSTFGEGVHPHLSIAGTGDAQGGYDSVQYSLSQLALNRFTDEQGIARMPVRAGARSFTCQVFQRLTDLILPVLEKPDVFSSSFMDQFTRLFCAQVVHEHNRTISHQHSHRGGLASWQKRRAIELLTPNADTGMAIPVIARECGLSVSHFARSFKISFGLPVHRWVILQRVERAKELLLSSNECLIQIAFEAGFSDQASFNRTFVRVVGSSPGRWRRYYKE